jgi:dienelactone hydrolase
LRILHIVSALAAALSLAACASDLTPASKMSDLELTWYQAQSAVPETLGGGIAFLSEPSRKERLESAGRKFPVVVYMHGCTGIGDSDRNLMRTLAKAGYVVVAPNSMARKYRPLQCASWNKEGGFNLFVFDFRQEEINFALQQMAGNAWADWDNLFIVGVSEGGLAAAHFRGGLFKARVITQWTCHGSTWVRGIDGPEDTPVLAVVRKDDPWYNSASGKQKGDCSAYFGDKRPGSESIVLEEGKGHDVIDDEGVAQRIVQFLGRYRKGSAEPPPQRGNSSDVLPIR